MVSWSADGLIAGYDPITKKLNPGLYHLASPGTVNLNGSTRIDYPLGSGLSATTYPNRLDASAPLTFTSGDVTANAGKVLSVALFIAFDSDFPAGHTPTPSEILALGDSRVSVYRGQYVTSAGTYTLNIQGPAGLPTNTKFWCLVLPVAYANAGESWLVSTTPPLAGINVDTVGRAVSLWSNRTPAKPVITSPTPNTIVTPGNTFTLTFNPADPDESTPEDTAKYNDDVIGVQIQYAPAPTADNPNPTWNDLKVGATEFGTVALEDGWIIKGARGSESFRLADFVALVNNLGLSIMCGNTSGTHVAGRGELPSGDWMLRVRTFDFGHPYPNEGTDWTQPGPAGINQNTTQFKYPAKDNYPAANTSPWSDSVKVSIPAQVPPPIPTSPTDDIAVAEGTTPRLAWQYRNTHNPARAQSYRTVQIRKVRDANWSTVASGVSGNPYIDLPPSLAASALPKVELLANGNFETNNTDGWAFSSGYAGYTTLTNTLDATKAHAGSRSLIATNNGTGAHKDVQITQTFTPSVNADYFGMTFDGWVWIGDATLHTIVLVQAYWMDSLGNPITTSPDGTIQSSPYVLYRLTAEVTTGAGWYKISDLIPYQSNTGDTILRRPPGGVSLNILLQVSGNLGDTIPEARFDDLTFSFDAVTRDAFTMSATTEYEWQVKAIDTDGQESNYSEVARFWVVPGAGSGGEGVVPSGTIEGATLGCGTHRVEVFRRGGANRVGEIRNISHLDWERKRDDISTAQIVVSGWDVDCGNLLAKLQTWAYEIVIFRDNGFSTERVWEGPITLLTYETDKVTIDAKDVMAYAYRRIIKQQMSDAGSGNGTTVVDRARRVLQNVFAPDDPNILQYLQVLAKADDSMQYRSTPAYSRTAFEEIDDMAANAGLDYTCVGRAILLWGTKHRIGTLPEFKDADLGNSPIVSEYGMSFANRYVVSDGNGVWGEATRLDVSGNDETYGLVEILSSTWASDSPSDTGTYTQAGLQTVIDSFESFAERSISDRYPPPVVVRIPDNTTINPGVTISIQHLVPGVVIPLRSTKTLRQVVASQKLDSIKVVEENGTEKVSITVSPFSRDDATTTEG